MPEKVNSAAISKKINNLEVLRIIRAEYDRLDQVTGVNTRSVKISLSSRLTRKYGYFSVVKRSVFAAPELSITIATRIVPGHNGNVSPTGMLSGNDGNVSPTGMLSGNDGNVSPTGIFSDNDSATSDWELFMDVIRHEYAHAVCYLRQPNRRHGHDEVWKKVCCQVGCIPKATRRVDCTLGTNSHGEATYLVKSRPYKYSVICSNCGAESKYKTESKVVKIAEGKIRGRLVCTKCGFDRCIVRKL